MADGTTIMLAALASVLVLYVVQQERKTFPALLGKKAKPTATLGTSADVDCSKVSIDSPDFARCSTTLGSGRTVIRGKPRADDVNTSFLKEEFNLGNPFAVKLDDKFVKDTDKKLGKSGGEAFPFSQSGGGEVSHAGGGKLTPREKESKGQLFKNVYGKPPPKTKTVEAPARGSSRSTVSLGSTEGVSFNTAFLGAAVSPSSLGASPEEITSSTKKLDNIDRVANNTGGNLNLLHPL